MKLNLVSVIFDIRLLHVHNNLCFIVFLPYANLDSLRYFQSYKLYEALGILALTTGSLMCAEKRAVRKFAKHYNVKN